MKTLRFSSQYKKDAKRFRNQPQKMEKVAKILQMLRDEIPIPERFSPHLLVGKLVGNIQWNINKMPREKLNFSNPKTEFFNLLS